LSLRVGFGDLSQNSFTRSVHRAAPLEADNKPQQIFFHIVYESDRLNRQENLDRVGLLAFTARADAYPARDYLPNLIARRAADETGALGKLDYAVTVNDTANRKLNIETPIIMLTARDAPSDAAFGLKLGADDYIPKPFDVAELLARVEAILRRTTRQTTKEIVTIGDVELDLRRLKTTKNGKLLNLSPREFEILHLLIANAGETVTREQMLHHIWGAHASLYTRTIDAHVTRLRHKIEEDSANPQHIITVHRVGYRLITGQV